MKLWTHGGTYMCYIKGLLYYSVCVSIARYFHAYFYHIEHSHTRNLCILFALIFLDHVRGR